jgi:acetoin:2,6-dichlorophenolindophenol oxidoreductase subunit beta
MTIRTFREAINDALRQEMERDDRIVIMGEDIRGGTGCATENVEAWGGCLGVTKGLWERFGSNRIIDLPITESAILGLASGAALTGLRPVAEIMFMDFVGVCLDGLYNQASKFRYMFGGKARTPMVVRGMIGAGLRAAAQHSQSPYHFLTAIPGLKVVVPSSPYDAKGLLVQAMRDDNPVIFCEHKTLYDINGEVPDELYAIPFGEARVVRSGKDVTIVALGKMVHHATTAAQTLAKEGISAEIIDPRTTSPLDLETIVESAAKCRRMIVVDESAARCGFAHDVAANAQTQLHGMLLAPIGLVTPPHTPIPFAPVLEDAWIPGPAAIINAVRALYPEKRKSVAAAG